MEVCSRYLIDIIQNVSKLWWHANDHLYSGLVCTHISNIIRWAVSLVRGHHKWLPLLTNAWIIECFKSDTFDSSVNRHSHSHEWISSLRSSNVNEPTQCPIHARVFSTFDLFQWASVNVTTVPLQKVASRFSSWERVSNMCRIQWAYIRVNWMTSSRLMHRSVGVTNEKYPTDEIFICWNWFNDWHWNSLFVRCMVELSTNAGYDEIFSATVTHCILTATYCIQLGRQVGWLSPHDRESILILSYLKSKREYMI